MPSASGFQSISRRRTRAQRGVFPDPPEANPTRAWPAEVANLGECHTPLLDLAEAHIPLTLHSFSRTVPIGDFSERPSFNVTSKYSSIGSLPCTGTVNSKGNALSIIAAYVRCPCR